MKNEMPKVQDRRLRHLRIQAGPKQQEALHRCDGVQEVWTSGGVQLMAKLRAHLIGPLDEETGEPIWEYWDYAQA